MDGVGHEVTGHVINLVTAVVLPVLVPKGVQLSHALGRLRLLIQLPTLHGVLVPAVQPEVTHLQPHTPCILAPLLAEPPCQQAADSVWRRSKNLSDSLHLLPYPDLYTTIPGVVTVIKHVHGRKT